MTEQARKSGPAPIRRRALLVGSTAIAAAAGYAVFAPEGQEGGADEERRKAAASDPRRLGYRETDHIRQFYARARF